MSLAAPRAGARAAPSPEPPIRGCSSCSPRRHRRPHRPRLTPGAAPVHHRLLHRCSRLRRHHRSRPRNTEGDREVARFHRFRPSTTKGRSRRACRSPRPHHSSVPRRLRRVRRAAASAVAGASRVARSAALDLKPVGRGPGSRPARTAVTGALPAEMQSSSPPAPPPPPATAMTRGPVVVCRHWWMTPKHRPELPPPPPPALPR